MAVALPSFERIVAIETSGPVGSVAAFAGGSLVGEWTSTVSNAHGESVFALLDQALAHAGWNKRDVELWAACVGPGSFTGVRVAISTALGIGMANGARTAGVTSFQAMRAHATGPSAVLIASLPGEYYLQVGDDLPELIVAAALAERMQDFRGALLGAWPAPFVSEGAAKLCAASVAHVAAHGTTVALEPLYIAPPRLSAPKSNAQT